MESFKSELTLDPQGTFLEEISDLINVAACDACVEIKNTFYKNRKEKEKQPIVSFHLLSGGHNTPESSITKNKKRVHSYTNRNIFSQSFQGQGEQSSTVSQKLITLLFNIMCELSREST